MPKPIFCIFISVMLMKIWNYRGDWKPCWRELGNCVGMYMSALKDGQGKKGGSFWKFMLGFEGIWRGPINNTRILIKVLNKLRNKMVKVRGWIDGFGAHVSCTWVNALPSLSCNSWHFLNNSWYFPFCTRSHNYVTDKDVTWQNITFITVMWGLGTYGLNVTTNF